MLDPFAIPHLFAKAPRLCGNPLCLKGLSLLNKQDLCYSCQDKARRKRITLPVWSSRPSPQSRADLAADLGRRNTVQRNQRPA